MKSDPDLDAIIFGTAVARRSEQIASEDGIKVTDEEWFRTALAAVQMLRVWESVDPGDRIRAADETLSLEEGWSR